MINLSPRLAAIGNEICKEETMADIGTDHGFLPVSLWERQICPKVIMVDVSQGSLAKARENCEKLYPEVNFDLRLGDGLKVLEPGEVDAVVMAGIGGMLMTEILEADLKKSKSFKKLILQPRNKVGRLRYWLYNHGFSVVKESLVREGKFICEILTVEPKEVAVSRNLDEDAIEYQFPRKLLDFQGPLTREYLVRKRDLELLILENMTTNGKLGEGELIHQQYRVDYLTQLINSCTSLGITGDGYPDAEE